MEMCYSERDMIKFAPKKYWIRCTYDEAILYCFQLKIDGEIGWRLPTRLEYKANHLIRAWYVGSTFEYAECVPVRDI